MFGKLKNMLGKAVGFAKNAVDVLKQDCIQALRVLRQFTAPVRACKAVVATALVVAGFASSLHAQTDATVITTAVTTAFVGVAGACVTIGTFFVVYRLVKRIK